MHVDQPHSALEAEGPLVPHPFSYGRDGRGRLFIGSRSLVRCITGEPARETMRLIAHPEFARLVGERKVIEAEMLDFVDGQLTLAHPKIPHYTFPFEWTAEMMRDAARTTLDVGEGAIRAGFVPLDLHYWNVVFRHTSPCFVDYGAFASIIDEETGRRRTYYPGDCFANSFLRVLGLMSQGYGALARAFMMKRVPLNAHSLPPLTSRAVLKQFLLITLRRYLGPRLYEQGRLSYRKVRPRTRLADVDGMLRCIESLRARLDSIRLVSHGTKARPESSSSLAAKREGIERMVSRLGCKEVVDLDCSEGFHGVSLARQGAHLVAIGSDEDAVSKIYFDAKRESLPVTPVLMFPLYPSPQPAHPHGDLVSVRERFSGDLLLATTSLAEFALERRADFVTLGELFSTLTRRFLVTDFVRPDDPDIVKPAAVPDWYDERRFERDFSRRFSVVERIPLDRSTRVRYLMERRQ